MILIKDRKITKMLRLRKHPKASTKWRKTMQQEHNPVTQAGAPANLLNQRSVVIAGSFAASTNNQCDPPDVPEPSVAS